jgi:hypothetical protein
VNTSLTDQASWAELRKNHPEYIKWLKNELAPAAKPTEVPQVTQLEEEAKVSSVD